tara:strand:- start:656 stop:2077 length:1422 start_codon:yes stop_codon:yes gene_type:complete
MSAWGDRAQALAQSIPLADFEPQALACLNHAPKETPWVIACSGGVDSVALACLMYAHFPKRRANLVIAHYNHALRAEASDGDAAFVAELAEGLRLPFVSEKNEVDLSASEAHLRGARFKFFDRVLEGCGGQLLLLAHQANDVAETILMRLARGSGLTGLVAPRPVHQHRGGRVHVRPILSLERVKIEASLKAAGIPWREDASNASGDYFRNRVRRTVLPALRECAPAELMPNMLLSRSLLEEDEMALEDWLDTFFGQAVQEGSLYRGPFLDKPKALYRRGLYRWLCEHGLVLSRNVFELVLEAFFQGEAGQWVVGEKRRIVGDGLVLNVEQVQDTFSWQPEGVLAPGGRVYFPDGSVLNIEGVSLSQEEQSIIFAGRVDSQKEAYIAQSVSCLRVRSWVPGDRYHPLGAPGTRKLQDIFTDKKIPREQRALLPLIENGSGELVWCPGLPPAEKSRLQPGTLGALRLTYRSTHG